MRLKLKICRFRAARYRHIHTKCKLRCTLGSLLIKLPGNCRNHGKWYISYSAPSRVPSVISYNQRSPLSPRFSAAINCREPVNLCHRKLSNIPPIQLDFDKNISLYLYKQKIARSKICLPRSIYKTVKKNFQYSSHQILVSPTLPTESPENRNRRDRSESRSKNRQEPIPKN